MSKSQMERFLQWYLKIVVSVFFFFHSRLDEVSGDPGLRTMLSVSSVRFHEANKQVGLSGNVLVIGDNVFHDLLLPQLALQSKLQQAVLLTRSCLANERDRDETKRDWATEADWNVLEAGEKIRVTGKNVTELEADAVNVPFIDSNEVEGAMFSHVLQDLLVWMWTPQYVDSKMRNGKS
jgi:hypothetical protein